MMKLEYYCMGNWHQQNGGRGISSAFTEHTIEVNFLRNIVYKNSMLTVNLERTQSDNPAK